MDRTRLIFVAIIGIAVVAVVAILVGNQFSAPENIVGLIGSEKLPFFQDERVQEALRRNGLSVSVQRAGSREIATSFDLGSGDYDFIFPAGAPAAEKIELENSISNSYEPFFTPMVIATWQPVAQSLAQQGVATNQSGYYGEAQQQDPNRYYSIVLMSDGENTDGTDYRGLADHYQTLSPQVQDIRTFTVLFGDADEEAMQEIADLTNGRLFDSTTDSLSFIFKQIRGYQ